jgi:hypothetical protein
VAAFGVAVHSEGIEGAGKGEKVFSLLVHLLPATLLAGTALLGWRRPLAGAIAYVVIGTGYCLYTWGSFPWDTLVTVAGPIMIVSVLFFITWLTRPKMA